MSFPRYPKYKPSGVEWLGEVPEGWTVRPLKTIASGTGALFIDGDWIESKDISSAGIRYLTSGNVGEGFYKEQGQGFITDETFNELKCTEVLPGDLLISRLNVPIGRACIVPDLGSRIVTCVDNVVVRPASIFKRQFCVFLLSCKGHLENTEILGRGATMPRLSRSALGRLPFAFPPLPEQTAIAEFLDRETGKIDGLVAEQRRLMELLKEKRQAVISHAITKGLNPHAPMKPSGIEWLGDVPEHWALPKLKGVATFSGGGTPSRDNPAYWNGDIPWVSPKDMKAERIEGAEESITEEGLRSSASILLPPGRVLIVVRSGILKHTIPIAINETEVALNQDMKALSFDPTKCVERFFFRWVQGHNEQLLLAWAKQGATVESIEHSYLAQTVVPLPAVAEQNAIVEYLETELAKFDTLTAEAQRAIDLLQERRTALISAAVTGQIDVRKSVV
jgi:type I restriction enzyme S subunit